ncbi:MAG: alkaline phosphatase family protein [Chloroflexota bacterium]
MLRWLRGKQKRVLVIGMDCVPPHFVFDAFRDDMPVLRQLTDGGTWGTLHSSVPCITVPAWSSMLTSRDPGSLGFYGFRNRAAHDYNTLTVADGSAVKHKRVWDYLSEAGTQNIVVSVPQTYPVRPINGHLVSGFMTPGTGGAFTFPAIYKSSVLKQFPRYAFDAKGFRTDDKRWLRQTISDVTDVQFKLFRHMLTTQPWGFAMFVNMGTDRIHHGFWRYHDAQHRLHEPGHALNGTIREYYKQVDTHIADILGVVGDNTLVLVVSDHGVTRMDGAICINEWLWREGWLALTSPPPEGIITRFEDLDVDWPNTRAWSTGGYYGRIFLNVQGREPQGTIPQDAVADARAELTAALKAIPAPDGTPLNTQVFEPQQIYAETNNIPPDLMIYFGDLHWRCVGSMGYDGIYTFENDTGPDDANHSPEGMFLLHDPTARGRGEIAPHQLMDIAPTILRHMGVDVPPDMQGRLIQ